MNGRERELAAIRHQVPDRIPTDVISIEIIPALAARLGVREADVYARLGIDGCLVMAPYMGEIPDLAENGVLYTEWGTPNTGDYGTARPYPLTAQSSLREVERFPWPRPEQYDYARAAQVAQHLGSDYAVRGPYWFPLFCRLCDLLGMEDAMVVMRTDEALFEAILDHVSALTLDYCRRLLDACGDAMPILCLGDDFATQRGLMISPGLWRRLLKPRYARLFELGKAHGKFVWFHSCGDITAILGDLIDIGVDVWETVQLHALPLSPSRLKREYGRHLTFFGGINTQRLPFARPEEVTAEVLAAIEALGEGGGYICGPDHHIKPDVSVDCALALFDTARAFRRRGYTAGS